MATSRHPRPRVDPAELLSITERARYLLALRLGLAAVVAAAVLVADRATVAAAGISAAPVASVIAAAATAAIVRRGGRAALPLLQGSLLVDGIYLAVVVALTGGAGSPLRTLAYAHVVAVTLLCSYRTGLKLALWHTLLFLLVVESMKSGLVGPAPDPAAGSARAVVLTLAGLWVFAIGTAASSAASERELRRQKHDLASLSSMVGRIEAAPGPNDIADILLDELCSTFGFVRGVVVASPEGRLEVLATTSVERPAARPEGPDPLMSRAWASRTTQLVRALDAGTDALLAAHLPDARNVLVVPLFLEGQHGIGVVALERGGTATVVRRWVVSMVERFAGHAALALHNAWLTEERESQLRTIQSLEHELRAHNADLEDRVAARTEELRAVIATLEEIDRQRRRLLAHVVRAAEDERRRIANDIHDDPVQKMVALKMRLELLRKMHPYLPDIDEACGAMVATIRSLRSMLFDLSPPILDEEGLGSALRYFLEHSRTPYRWSVVDELDDEPSAQSRLILYRIAQEALANVRKHAEAAHVRMTLRERDGGVWMEVTDDGIGFEPQEALVAAPGHMGLAAMRERAEMAGGSCTLRSLPGAGTTLEVWLPWEDAVDVPTGPSDREEPVADVLLLPTDGHPALPRAGGSVHG